MGTMGYVSLTHGAVILVTKPRGSTNTIEQYKWNDWSPIHTQIPNAHSQSVFSTFLPGHVCAPSRISHWPSGETTFRAVVANCLSCFVPSFRACVIVRVPATNQNLHLRAALSCFGAPASNGMCDAKPQRFALQPPAVFVYAATVPPVAPVSNACG